MHRGVVDRGIGPATEAWLEEHWQEIQMSNIMPEPSWGIE